MPVKLNFSELPKDTKAAFVNGLYKLKFLEAIESTSNEGAVRIVMAHSIVGTTQKVNYDTYTIFRADGTIHPFGTGKLRKLIDAMHLEVDDITVPLLNTLMKDKFFKAYLVTNERGYPQLNYDDIYPLEYEEAAINEQAAVAPQDDAETVKQVMEKMNIL